MSGRSAALMMMVSAAIIAALGVGTGSPTLASSGPLVVLAIGAEVRRGKKLAADRALADSLPTVVDQLIQQLRAGRSLAQSCQRLDRLELGQVVEGLPSTLSDLRSARPPIRPGARPTARSSGSVPTDHDHSLQLLAVTLDVLAGNGGPAVPALQRLRHTLISVVNGRRRADAEASQALASAGILVMAPSLFAVVVALLDPGAASLYIFEPIGAVCVLSALTLSWLGWLWIQRLLAAARRPFA
ncbi:MAG: type II secretion system F family protein [Acidimicrobiales bacterium]